MLRTTAWAIESSISDTAERPSPRRSQPAASTPEVGPQVGQERTSPPDFVDEAAPSFETSFRGYDKRQVDTYVQIADREISTLAYEREEAYSHVGTLNGRVRQLTDQVSQLQRELSDALRKAQ
jgi:hypothetical protein